MLEQKKREKDLPRPTERGVANIYSNSASRARIQPLLPSPSSMLIQSPRRSSAVNSTPWFNFSLNCGSKPSPFPLSTVTPSATITPAGGGGRYSSIIADVPVASQIARHGTSKYHQPPRRRKTHPIRPIQKMA